MERKEHTRLFIAMRGLERALRGPVLDDERLLCELATLKYEVDTAWSALQHGARQREIRAEAETGPGKDVAAA
jgi:hypothetical protein